MTPLEIILLVARCCLYGFPVVILLWGAIQEWRSGRRKLAIGIALWGLTWPISGPVTLLKIALE